jgi:hypothetical protein
VDVVVGGGSVVVDVVLLVVVVVVAHNGTFAPTPALGSDSLPALSTADTA